MIPRKLLNPFLLTAAIIVGVSGLLMFFHIKSSLIEELHEIVGLLFVIGFLLHLLNNRKPLAHSLTGKFPKIIIAAVIIGAITAMAFSEKKIKKPTPQAPAVENIQS